MTLRSTVIPLVWLILAPVLSGMKVGTYNIRYDNPGDVENGNQWPRRAPVIASLIRFHEFDVLGTQEGFQHQMEDLRKLLPEYGCVSYGRNDGKLEGEHAGIFYRKDRFEVLESGMFWLSETPDRPGRGWDADLPRICSWAKMRRIPDGKPFCFMTVHLDHRGKLARMESMKLLLAKSSTLAGENPVFLVGDFNTDQHSEAYRYLTSQGSLMDAAEKAEVRYLLNGTANRFDPDSKTEKMMGCSETVVAVDIHNLVFSIFFPRRPGSQPGRRFCFQVPRESPEPCWTTRAAPDAPVSCLEFGPQMAALTEFRSNLIVRPAL